MEAAVLVEQVFCPVPGGTGRYTRDLLDALESSRPAGAVVTRWSARGSDPAPTTRRLPLRRRELSLAWSWRFGPAPSGCDVIHAPTMLAPPRREIPVVVTIHDAVPWTHPQTLTAHGARWHRRMGARLVREADAVVVPSKAVAESLYLALPGLAADRLVVAANPVSPTRSRGLSTPLPTDGERAERLGLPDDGFLLFVGTREPRKGLDVLAAALDRPDGPRLPLLLVGPTGWGDVEVAQSAGRIRALGRLDDEDLDVVYRRATVLVLPSRAEGFGYPVVESMLAGTPVVTSDDPALVETGSGATLTVPVGDAAALADVLRRVERDASLRAELVELGRARARDFDAKAYGARMWDVYSAAAF